MLRAKLFEALCARSGADNDFEATDFLDGLFCLRGIRLAGDGSGSWRMCLLSTGKDDRRNLSITMT